MCGYKIYIALYKKISNLNTFSMLQFLLAKVPKCYIAENGFIDRLRYERINTTYIISHFLAVTKGIWLVFIVALR